MYPYLNLAYDVEYRNSVEILGIFDSFNARGERSFQFWIFVDKKSSLVSNL